MENGGGSSGGWSSCMQGGAYKVLGNMYGGDVPLAASSGGGSVVARNLQPFDVFSLSDINSTAAAFKSTGGMAAAGVEFPFTSSQWKELERQAMIYKYMTASVPVPADLLFAFSRSIPAPPNHSISLTGGDPDLKRCKRTDGKKWRCSRDVAPQQKYCERHLQKSRPRSRKPVEVKNTASPNNGTTKKKNPLLFNPRTGPSISTSSSKKSERSSALTEGAMVAGQQCQHLVDASVGFGDEGSIYNSIASVFRRDYVEQQPLNMFSYTEFRASEDVKHSGGEGDNGVSFNPDLSFVERHSQKETTGGFIDAWSNDYLHSINESSSIISEQGNLSNCPLNLSMAMSAGNVLDDEMRNDRARMLSTVSRIPFAQGGPLAEALRPGSIAGGGSNPASPYDSTSTPTTTVSSPSGVLHKTLFFSL